MALPQGVSGCAVPGLDRHRGHQPGRHPAWATTGYHITATIGVGHLPIAVAVSPDGTHIYVADDMGRGRVSVITRH